MTGGLDKSFAVLAKTRNEAATGMLLKLLDAASSEVRLAALRAVARRRSAAAQLELLRRWHTFSGRSKSIVAEHTGRISAVLRDAVLSADEQLCGNACDVVQRLREYDLIPALITAAEDRANPLADLAADTLLALAEMLFDELAGPRDYRNRRDPQLVRNFVLGALESSLARFDQHRRREILEAFLLLASRENSLLKGLLNHVHEKVYLATVSLLTSSRRPGVMRLLLSYLDDQHAPTTIHSILTRRSDVPFLRHLARKVAGGLSPNVKINLKRIDAFSWLRDDLSILLALSEEEQRGIVVLVMASGMNRLRAFEVVRFVLRRGGTEGRRAAAEVLHHFTGAEANELMLASLADDDAQVQASVIGHLRERGIPGAMQRLVELIDSPHEEVREAARGSLTEFCFERFLGAFDTLEESVRRNTGRLVKLVDPTAVAQLRDEFQTPSRNRRLRALGMAMAMQVAPQVESDVILTASDPDQFLRCEAARALADCDSETASNALRELLLDRVASVQEAAEQALAAQHARAVAAASRTGRSPATLPPAPSPPPVAPTEVP